MSHLFSKFTNQYSLSKTLRFALKPVGKTKELFDNIQNNENPLQQVIEEDKKRAEQYKKAKKIIDEYHKDFISKTLENFSFQEEDLLKFDEAYNVIKKHINKHSKTKSKKKKELSKEQYDEYSDNWSKEKDEFETILQKIQERLRKQVANKFRDEHLFKKEFIQKILPKWLEENTLKLDEIEEPQKIIKEFNSWSTYFRGFNENRKNIYTDKAQSTSIGYRLIHENFPRFLNNIECYKKARDLGINFSEVEDNFSVKLDDVFSLHYFNQCLNQKGIEHYNLIRGGQSYSDNRKKQGVNEIINLASQQLEKLIKEASDEEKSALKKKKKNIGSCLLEKLNKQILSDQNIISFRLEDIKDDASLCEKINATFSFKDEELIGQYEQADFDTKKIEIIDFKIIEKIKKSFENLELVNPEEIYIQNSNLADISNNIFSNHELLTRCLENYNESEKNPLNAKGKKETKKRKMEKEKWLKKSYFSFHEIHEALNLYFTQYGEKELAMEQQEKDKENSNILEYKEKAMNKPLQVYFRSFQIKKENETIDLLKVIKKTYDDAKLIFEESQKVKKEKLKAEKDKVEKIKNYLDSLMDLYHFLKPLYVTLTKQEEKQIEIYIKDSSFYVEFDPIFEVLHPIIPLYNQTRNYLTKKNHSTEKYKLNFKNSTLADGWAEDKEKDNTCVLLLKDGLYYLAIMDKKHNNLFLEENTTPEGLNKQLKLQEEEESKNLDALTKRKKGTKSYINLQNKIQDIKDEKIRLRHILSLILQKESSYQKMIYKYFKDGTTMIPKCSTQLNEVKEHFINDSKEDDYILKGKSFQTDLIITKEIFKLNNYVFDEKELKFVLKKDKDDKRPKKFQKDYVKLSEDQKGYQEAIEQWIKFCERFLKSYQSTVGFNYGELFKKSYNSLDIFYNNLNHCIYKINFQDISSEYIKLCMEEGKLYLFQIYSKDFSPKSKGKPNLQTLYWKALFDEKKMNGDKKELGVYKLNGQAELFYRKKSIEYSEEIWREGHHFNELKKKQHYPIIKDRRYAKDTFLFHASITCNFKASNINKFNDKFNDKVNGFLKNNSDIHIIGIDRGERHLAYYTLINQQGEILEQESLNTIVSQYKKDGKNIEKEKNYHSLLDKREKERNEARKSWRTIEKIKDLKAGYLSQVVHKIVTLMIKYNAIIVFEDLNFGFKQGRFKVEKQVYQKLEKMLIDKLNYLVLNKEEGSHEVGGTFNALQLTAPFESFKKIDKQTGFIFYVPAYHTSKICPATGFVNLLYPRYETLEKVKKFFREFDKICFNKKEDYFEFHFNYKKFPNKVEGSQQDWVVCSHGGRLENVKENNKWKTRQEEIILTKEFKGLFHDKIAFEDGQCLKSTIDQQEDRKFFKDLIRLLKLTLQMRNSRINDDEDWLISPVKDKHGNFFNSRNQNEKMPKNTDANGAYHIALKGLLMLKQLNEGEDHQNFKPDLSNKEWYQFVHKKNKT